MANIDETVEDIIEKYDNQHHLDFEAFYDHHKERLSEGSIVQYSRYLQHIDFDPVAERLRPDVEIYEDRDTEFTLDDFVRWSVAKFNSLENQDIDQTRWKYNVYLSLKRYLEAVGKEDVKNKLPAPNDLSKPRSNKKTFRLDRNQIEKLLDASESEDLRLAIILMAYSGLRISEVLQLKLEFIECKEDNIEILLDPEYLKKREKRDTADTAFLDSKYAPELKEHAVETFRWNGRYRELEMDIAENNLESRPIINLHPQIKEKVLNDEMVEKNFSQLHRERQKANNILKKTAERAGLNNSEKLSCHTLRRSFIHIIQETTGDLNKTSQLARHNDPNTTKDYYLELEKKEMARTYNQAF
jgi:integrase